MQTTIIIPCYNEANRLPIAKFQHFIANHRDINFLFVNDGSTDNTLQVIETLCSQSIQFQLLDLKENGGKAAAVREGMLYAAEQNDSDYIGFWDADLATPLSEIDNFLIQIARADFDMVTGLRLMRLGAGVKRKKMRHYLGRCFATTASQVLDLPVYDTQCGAKLYKSSVVAQIFAEPFITRWLFDVELLARYIKFYGHDRAIMNIYEYPVLAWEDVGGSQVKIKDFFKAPRELVKIKRKYR